MKTIKDYVSGDKVVTFLYYKDYDLYYTTDCGLIFKVPIEDCGEAPFNATERAMLMMRYIRKHLEQLKSAILSNESE